MMRATRSGQATMEFALLFTTAALPLTFMLIVTAQMLWIWHSVVDFTRDAARYAATHCFTGDGSNVLAWMQSHVPAMIDQNQFQNGTAIIQVQYYSRNPDGTLAVFSGCDATCSAACIPDDVSVGIASYQYMRFSGFFKLPPVTIPTFTTTIPMESAGCDESGNCNP